MTEKKRHSRNHDDYAIGYGRPPLRTRFQSGRSGNPKGRPKGSKNFNTLIAEELAQPVVLTENGRRKKMSKQQALAKQLTNRALSNDLKAAALVIDHARRSEESPEGAGPPLCRTSRRRTRYQQHHPSGSAWPRSRFRKPVCGRTKTRLSTEALDRRRARFKGFYARIRLDPQNRSDELHRAQFL